MGLKPVSLAKQPQTNITQDSLVDSDRELQGSLRDSIGVCFRRGGVLFSEHVSGGELRPMRVPREGKSCLKIETQEDSLRIRYGQKNSVSWRKNGAHGLTNGHNMSSRVIQQKVQCFRNEQEKGKRGSFRRKYKFCSNSGIPTGYVDTTGLTQPLASEGRNNCESKNVFFHRLTIRAYECFAGDNPCVKSGPAVTLGWKYVSMGEIDIDTYERSRGPRKLMKEIKLSNDERLERLRASGVTEEEIWVSTKNIEIAKRKRMATLRQVGDPDQFRRFEKRMLLKAKILKKMSFFQTKDKNDEDEEDALWTEANK